MCRKSKIFLVLASALILSVEPAHADAARELKPLRLVRDSRRLSARCGRWIRIGGRHVANSADGPSALSGARNFAAPLVIIFGFGMTPKLIIVGLGTYLLSANAQMNTVGVYAAMMLMTLIGVGSFVLLLVIEYIATPWRHRMTGGSRAIRTSHRP